MDKTIYASILGVIILIPGYSEGPEIWNGWNGTILQFKDPCGTVADHAREIQEFIGDKTNVTIVAHSKAGLDARAFIAENPGIVKNLIMIGTPNEGTPAAYMEVTPCWMGSMAGRTDMIPGAPATKTPDNNNTNYYAIAGDYAVPCYIIIERPTCYVVPNDGFVTVDSAISHYKSLGVFPYNHTGLLQEKDVYDAVKPIF